NSVGDYYVVRDDGQKEMFPNDGRRIGRRLPGGAWVDYRIDVSVGGRLKMFEDGVRKLLDPNKRHRWVKRTSADSALIPDLGNAVRQFTASVLRDVIAAELRQLLRERQVPPAAAEALLGDVDGAVRRAVRDGLADAEVSFRFAWAAAQLRTRDHVDRVFDLL